MLSPRVPTPMGTSCAPLKGEDRLIGWIRSRWSARGEGEVLGIGDDMAILARPRGDSLIACDMLMDGVDFDALVHSPRQIGRKAMAVNLSDCAAMAVRPRWALVSLALPNAWTMTQAEELVLGIEDVAGRYDVRLVGGDTNSWPTGLVINVTIVAEPWDGIAPVRRDGARPGDVLAVTGRLGGSIQGRHLSFEPRIKEARELATAYGSALHAMLDLSDGVSTDAARMAEASGVGIQLNEDAVLTVVSDDARQLAQKDGRAELAHALNDGEDFELLMAIGAEAHEQPTTSVDVTVIGSVVDEPGVWIVSRSGERTVLPAGGWQHFT